MKVLGLVVGMMLMASLAWADCTAKIIGVDKDEQGSIRVKTQYILDGQEVISRYPQQDGKYYWVTRYNVQNFANMTKAQVLGRIKKDIKAFQEHLIIDSFMKINNDAFVKTADNLVNATNTETTANIDLDLNSDGIPDTRWQVTSDGNKTVVSLP